MSSLFDLNNRIQSGLLFSILLLLPTQFGKHFWPDFSLVLGLRMDYLSPTLYLTDILIGLSFIVWLCRARVNIFSLKRYFRNEFGNQKNLFIRKLLIFLLFVYLLCGAINSQNPFNSYVHILKLGECLFLGYAISQTIFTEQLFKKALVALSLGTLFSSLLAIAQFISQGSLGGAFYYLGERTFTSQTPGIANASINGELLLRPYATFSHPNVLAGYLLCVLVLLLTSLSAIQKKVVRLLFAITILIGTCALFLTLSRVAIALWMLVILSSLLFVQKRVSIRIGLFTSVICLLGILFFATPLGTRFMQTQLSEESVVQREQLVSAAVYLIRLHPFGVGLGNFLPVLSHLPADLYPSNFVQPVHNIFLLITVETGVIGICFFLALLFVTYRQLSCQRNRSAFSLSVVLTLLLIMGLFDHYLLTVQQGQLLFSAIIGLCWSPFAKTQLPQ